MTTTQRRVHAMRSSMLIALLGLSACATPMQPHTKLLRLARAADASYQSGDLAVARRQYEELLQANPNYATAHVRLGAIAYRRGDRESAKKRFESALRTDPKNDVAIYNLAMLNLNEASRYLERYVAVGSAPAHRERVLRLLERLRRFETK